MCVCAVSGKEEPVRHTSVYLWQPHKPTVKSIKQAIEIIWQKSDKSSNMKQSSYTGIKIRKSLLLIYCTVTYCTIMTKVWRKYYASYLAISRATVERILLAGILQRWYMATTWRYDDWLAGKFNRLHERIVLYVLSWFFVNAFNAMQMQCNTAVSIRVAFLNFSSMSEKVLSSANNIC